MAPLISDREHGGSGSILGHVNPNVTNLTPSYMSQGANLSEQMKLQEEDFGFRRKRCD